MIPFKIVEARPAYHQNIPEGANDKDNLIVIELVTDVEDPTWGHEPLALQFLCHKKIAAESVKEYFGVELTDPYSKDV